MNEERIGKLKYLHLHGLQTKWDEYLAMAAAKRFSHSHLLTHIVEEEYRLKQDNARKLRLQRAGLPELLLLETFPFERQPKLNKKRILALYGAQISGNGLALVYGSVE